MQQRPGDAQEPLPRSSGAAEACRGTEIGRVHFSQIFTTRTRTAPSKDRAAGVCGFTCQRGSRASSWLQVSPARRRPEAARPNPTLDMRPCWGSLALWTSPEAALAGAPAPAEVSQLQLDCPSAEDARQRLLGSSLPCCPAAMFPVFQGFETQAEMVPKGKLQMSG